MNAHAMDFGVCRISPRPGCGLGDEWVRWLGGVTVRMLDLGSRGHGFNSRFIYLFILFIVKSYTQYKTDRIDRAI